MKRNQVLPIIAVALVVSLAGCGAISGITGPTVSNAEATVVDGYPAIVFEYDTDEHSMALLEGPDGEIVDETRIEPAYNTSELFFDDPRAGEYRILIRQGGETVASKTLEFEGADAEIENIEPVWSDNTLESVKVTVRNDGDLPLWVREAGYVISGEGVKKGIRESVDTGETKTIEIVAGYGEQITVEERGKVKGSVSIESLHGVTSEEFTKTIEAPNLEIVSVNPKWSGSVLEEVEVTVRNTGDAPTTANVSVEHENEQIGYHSNKGIEPGETVEFHITDPASLFEPESSGTAEFEVRVNSDYEVKRSEFSREIEAASISIDSVSTTWENGKLTGVKYSASNAGDVGGEYDVTVSVNGEVIEEGTVTIPPEGTNDVSLIDTSWYSGSAYKVESGGTYEVKLTIETDQGTVSETDVVEFDGADPSIIAADATFYDSFDSDKHELSSLDFTVRNDGDIPLYYDTIEISLGSGTRSSTSYSTTTLKTGESKTEYFYLSDNISVESGTHELTIRLKKDGETVFTETVTVSTG